MGTQVALAQGFSTIQCSDGTQGDVCHTDPTYWQWDAPSVHNTSATSNNKFFVGGIPVAVQGDAMESHPDGSPCTPTPINHSPIANICASKLRIAGKYVVRVGGHFDGVTPYTHVVATGSPNLIIGGPDITVGPIANVINYWDDSTAWDDTAFIG